MNEALLHVQGCQCSQKLLQYTVNKERSQVVTQGHFFPDPMTAKITNKMYQV